MPNKLIPLIRKGETLPIITAITDAHAIDGIIALTQERNNNNESPIMCAIKKGYAYVALLLIRYDDNINYQVPSSGETALMYAVKKGSVNLVESILEHESIIPHQIPLERDIQVDIQDSQGNTALMLAAQGGNESILALLVTAGAQTALQNNALQTASEIALANNHVIPSYEEAMIICSNLHKAAPYLSDSSDDEDAALANDQFEDGVVPQPQLNFAAVDGEHPENLQPVDLGGNVNAHPD